jgi:hypothetical protein
VGFPIRISADQSSFAAPRGFSQRSTSFIASQRQGIHQMPLVHLIALIINAHPALGARSRIQACALTGGTLIRKTSLQDRTDDSLRSGTEPTSAARDLVDHAKHRERALFMACGRKQCSERSSLHDVRYHAATRAHEMFMRAGGHEFVFKRTSCKPDWWSQTGSNRRPPACKAGALPAELWPLLSGSAGLPTEARGKCPGFAFQATPGNRRSLSRA